MNERDRHLASIVKNSARAYAVRAVELQLETQPDAIENYGSHYDLQGDTEMRLLFLAAALASDRAELFLDQISWLKVAMFARKIEWKYLDQNLLAIGKELEADLPEGLATRPLEFLALARVHLASAPDEIPSFLESGGEFIDLARKYLLAVLEGRSDDAMVLVSDAYHSGVSPESLCHDVIHLAQREIGRMWQMDEIHVAEEHYGSRIAERVLSVLQHVAPRSESSGRRVLCAAPGGELHELGLRVVSQHFEWGGWDSILLGANMPIPDLVRGLCDFEADLVALSATTPLQVEPVFALIEEIRKHASLPVLVGGAPFCKIPDLWQVVGADGCSQNASQAVEVAASLLAAR